MTILPHTLRHATRNPTLRGSALRVLIELHESLTTGEFKPVKPWHIAEMLRADRGDVQRALDHLVELGYLERGDRFGNGFTFRLLSPVIGETPPPHPAFAA